MNRCVALHHPLQTRLPACSSAAVPGLQ